MSSWKQSPRKSGPGSRAALERGAQPAWRSRRRSETGGALLQRLLQVKVNSQAIKRRLLHEVRVDVHAVVAVSLELVDTLELSLRRLDHRDVPVPNPLAVT